MKLCVTIRYINRQELCHICGSFYNDITTHIVLNCTLTEKVRDELWCCIINISDIMFSVYLHSLSSDSLIHILLGGPLEFELSPEELESFRLSAVIIVWKMIKLYYP